MTAGRRARWSFVLADPEARTHASDLHDFAVATGILVAFWFPIAVGAPGAFGAGLVAGGVRLATG